MPRAAAATRERILGAAERLFAERGTGQVSLKEINAAAGQRNTAAVHYHFKNREQLLRAVLEPHLADVDERRRELLDGLDAGGATNLASLVRVLVEPLAAKLDDKSGRSFLCIQAELAPQESKPRPSTRRLMKLVGEALARQLPEPVARSRGELAQLLLFPALSERARREAGRRDDRGGRELFVEGLIDALVGVLSAPVSERSRRLLPGTKRGAERGMARRARR